MPESYKEEFFRCRNELHQLGIFEIRQPDRDGQRYYVLTDIGQRFLRQNQKTVKSILPLDSKSKISIANLLSTIGMS